LHTPRVIFSAKADHIARFELGRGAMTQDIESKGFVRQG